MKTLNFFRKPYLVYAISFMFLFASCSIKESDNEPDNKTNKTEQLKEFLSQMYDTSFSTFEVLDVSENINPNSRLMSELIAKNNNTVLGSFYLQVDTNQSDGIVEFNTITTDVTSDSSGEYYTTYTEFRNEFGYSGIYKLVLKKIAENQFETVSYEVISINGNQNKSFTSCMGDALDTDYTLGQALVGLGIASSVGCVACGIAAAFLFGTAMFVCSAA